MSNRVTFEVLSYERDLKLHLPPLLFFSFSKVSCNTRVADLPGRCVC